MFPSDGNSQDSKMDFSEDEDKLITRMYNLVGERSASFHFCFELHLQLVSCFSLLFPVVLKSRWSLIAGRIPGRTAEEIERYWTSRYSTSE